MPTNFDLPSANKELLSDFAARQLQNILAYAAAGQLVDLKGIAELLNKSPEEVLDAEASLRIFSLVGHDQNRLYPAFFASTKIKRDTVEAVCLKLSSLSGGSKWQFFTTPKLSLRGRTPLAALESGERASVLVAAAVFLEN